MRVLKRGPRRVNDERGQNAENDEWLQPPCVAPLRFTEPSVKKRERCMCHVREGAIGERRAGFTAREMDCPLLAPSMLFAATRSLISLDLTLLVDAAPRRITRPRRDSAR